MLTALLFSVVANAASTTPELQVTIGSYSQETVSFFAEGETRKITLQPGSDTRRLQTKSVSKSTYDKWSEKFLTLLKKAQGDSFNPDCQVNVSAKIKGSPKHYCLDDKQQLDAQLGELWVKMKDAIK